MSNSLTSVVVFLAACAVGIVVERATRNVQDEKLLGARVASIGLHVCGPNQLQCNQCVNDHGTGGSWKCDSSSAYDICTYTGNPSDQCTQVQVNCGKIQYFEMPNCIEPIGTPSAACAKWGCS